MSNRPIFTCHWINIPFRGNVQKQPCMVTKTNVKVTQVNRPRKTPEHKMENVTKTYNKINV